MMTLPFTLRAILLWLTLLALPSLAAAAAQPCALHEHVSAAAATSARMASAASAAHAAPMQMAVMAPHRTASLAGCHDAPGQSDRHGGHAHGHCSACAACCAGVAPAPAFTLAPGGPGAAFVAAPFRPGHLPSVDPLPFERPPRPAFA